MYVKKEEQATKLKAPDISYIEWAKNLLSILNLAILELDTTGLREDDEIIRILLLDRLGDRIFDTFIRPEENLSNETIQITGITDSELETAPMIINAWDQIRDALSGKYLLSFNFDFDKRMLREAAERNELEMPHIIGECLMEALMIYNGSSTYSKLSTLCARIGHPLPEYPHQTALNRAKGQLALLTAMSQGVIIEEDE